MFIYVFEDGVPAYSKDKPTERDIEMVMDGILIILKVDSESVPQEANFEGTYQDIPKAKLVSRKGQLYHEDDYDEEENE